jgi:DNA-binding NarL/FixJ family response regulator
MHRAKAEATVERTSQGIRTVDVHRARLLKRLGVRSMAEAARL